MCALCDLDLGGRHLCPACVTEGTPATASPGGGDRARAGGELSNERFLYDHMALTLAVAPLVLLWPVTLFTAPAALFYAVRYWNDPPRGFIPRRRYVIFTAALLALAEIAAWGCVGATTVFPRTDRCSTS